VSEKILITCPNSGAFIRPDREGDFGDPETMMGGLKQRKIRMIGVCAALALHAMCLVLFVMATPKPETTLDLAPSINLELWSLLEPEIARSDPEPAKAKAQLSPTMAGRPLQQHIPPQIPLQSPSNARDKSDSKTGDAGFGRWAVARQGGGSLSEGLKHPRRCFGLDIPPEGRPKDCPEWAVNGTPIPSADPTKDYWRRDIQAIDRHWSYRDKVHCNNPNGSGVTALQSHRGDRVNFRTGCRGDQDARDEVDFKKGQTVDTKNQPDYGS
jgi:hypothetical protein